MLLHPRPAKVSDECEGLAGHELLHRLGIAQLHDPVPAELLLVLSREDVLIVADGYAQFPLLIDLGLLQIQLTHEQQVGHLLDDVDGIGDPPGPENVPNVVYLVLQRASNHADDPTGPNGTPGSRRC